MAGSRVGEEAMGGVGEGEQRDGGSGQGSKFGMQTFGLQVAEVMEAILPELDPTGTGGVPGALLAGVRPGGILV